MCEHGGYPDFCKHCTTQRIAELDERLRVQDQWRRELEQRVKELEAALSDTPCLCIGPRPSVDEGTMCSRCAALEGGKQDE